MTFVARLTLPERDAARLTEHIGEDFDLGHPAVDALETKKGIWEVTVYFEAKPSRAVAKRLEAVARDLLGARAPAFALAELPDSDWVAKSLEGLKPVRAGRFLVHGAHDRGRRVGNLVNIEIEAGLAFGTGHHATTAGCLVAIDAVARVRRPRQALDLGTGSGVLAIALAKSWHVPVLASDIDKVAVRVAAENVRLNGVRGLVHVVAAAGFRHLTISRRKPFDLILANILAGPLSAMARRLADHLSPGGTAILSGILPGQDKGVLAAYRNSGLRLQRRTERDGWVTLILRRG